MSQCCNRCYLLQILIENSESIGALPPHIAHSVSNETSGSMDNGLDSFELHGRSKKKKHRSGSLTRKPYPSASNFNLSMSVYAFLLIRT